jgi:hypothetical protein
MVLLQLSIGLLQVLKLLLGRCLSLQSFPGG